MQIARYDSLIASADRGDGHPHDLPGAAGRARTWCSTGETHLLGIRMSDRPLDLGVAAGVLRPAGRRRPIRLRKLSDIFSRLQRGRGRRRPHLRTCSTASRTVRDPPQPAPLPRHHRDLAFENVELRLPARPAGAATTSTCGSPSARRSPSSAPTAAARARWPI